MIDRLIKPKHIHAGHNSAKVHRGTYMRHIYNSAKVYRVKQECSLKLLEGAVDEVSRCWVRLIRQFIRCFVVIKYLNELRNFFFLT